MDPQPATARRPPGRPRSFDRDVALERAMNAFWAHGYETTSIAELTSAMGITAPSLYSAFGDKRTLFLEALDRYLGGGPEAVIDAIDAAPDARDAARDMLERSAVLFTGRRTPRGCLLATATASCSPASADVQETLAGIRLKIEARLRKRIERDIVAGVLPRGTDAVALAGLVAATVQGLSSLARDGASRAKLLTVVAAAMSTWP